MNYLKKSIIYSVIFFTFVLISDGRDTDTEKITKKNYRSAKRLIIKKDWKKAIELLENIADISGTGTLKDNSLYWLAYSLKKHAGLVEDREKQVDTLESAIDKLNNLIENFPSSNWVDDGKILRIEIAEDLIKKGFSGYKKIIDKSSEETSKENIKLFALDALLNMDDKRAFPLLKKLITGNYSLKIKKKAVFVLSQNKNKGVLPFLTEIVLLQGAFELKEKAVFWIGQINGKEGLDSLLKLYKRVKEETIKKKIIFSIAQTGKMGIVELIRIYNIEENLKLKKKILFWIGQSKSKVARDFITKVLLG